MGEIASEPLTIRVPVPCRIPSSCELLVSGGCCIHTRPVVLILKLFKHLEQRHHVQDTFWFWLSWVAPTLPGCNTETAVAEPLLLQEMQADRWAAQQVNPGRLCWQSAHYPTCAVECNWHAGIAAAQHAHVWKSRSTFKLSYHQLAYGLGRVVAAAFLPWSPLCHFHACSPCSHYVENKVLVPV